MYYLNRYYEWSEEWNRFPMCSTIRLNQSTRETILHTTVLIFFTTYFHIIVQQCRRIRPRLEQSWWGSCPRVQTASARAWRCHATAAPDSEPCMQGRDRTRICHIGDYRTSRPTRPRCTLYCTCRTLLSIRRAETPRVRQPAPAPTRQRNGPAQTKTTTDAHSPYWFLRRTRGTTTEASSCSRGTANPGGDCARVCARRVWNYRNRTPNSYGRRRIDKPWPLGVRPRRGQHADSGG